MQGQKTLVARRSKTWPPCRLSVSLLLSAPGDKLQVTLLVQSTVLYKACSRYYALLYIIIFVPIT